MDSDRWQEIRQCFRVAHGLRGDARRRYLADTARADQALADEVGRLLDGVDEAEEHLGDIVSGAVLAAQAGESRPGEVISHYRIVDVLGEGGMGKVYLAERADDQYRQQVAIKIVGRHAATGQVVERFRAERQILANLDHPNIARLLDGGETEDGLPYLVMEYVDGQSIVAYCREHKLGLEERLGLFLRVCDAIDHAHRNLVIHRDIKPANILVTPAGLPKLLDFGIAKLLETETAGGEMAVTQADVRMLTPEYASPEQITGSPVTTATDVYGLGLLLYELLTDRFPYGSRDRLATDWRRMIVDRDPERPSTAVGKPEATDRTTIVAAQPAAELKERRARLRGDLDNIIMTALRKEPERRYASARALADDLRAYLEHRPVTARPATARYRVGKFLRRHRVGVAVAASVVAFIIALVVFYTNRLAEERDHAQRAAATSAKVVEFITGLFEEADPSQSLGVEVTARTLLEQGARRLQQELVDEPVVRARMLDAIGSSFASMGEFQSARDLFIDALDAKKASQGVDVAAITESHLNVGAMQLELGDLAAAEQHLSAARDTFAEASAAEPMLRVRMRLETARLREEVGDYAAADALYVEATSLLRDLGPERSDELANALQLHSELLRSLERRGEALAMLEESLAIRRERHGEVHPGIAMSLNGLGNFYQAQGELDTAERYHRESMELKVRLYGDDSIRVARSRANLAVVQHRRGRYREAEALSKEALPVFVAALGEDHPHVAFLLENIANDQLALGRHEEALATYRSSQEKMLRIFGPDHVEYGISLSNLGGAFVVMGRYREAREPLEQADAIFTSELGPDNGQVFSNRIKIADARFGLGEYAAAESEYRRILATTEALYEVHTDIANPREMLGRAVLAQGRPEEAEGLLRQAVADWRAAAGEDSSNVWRAATRHAEALVALERYAEAATLVADSYAAQLEAFGRAHDDTRATRAVALQLYTAWNRPEMAARFE